MCVSPFDCRQVEYLLKWRNYTDSDNTWEPVEHLECPEMIKAFEDERKKREKEDERRNRDEKDVSFRFTICECIEWHSIEFYIRQTEEEIGAETKEDGKRRWGIDWRQQNLEETIGEIIHCNRQWHRHRQQ